MTTSSYINYDGADGDDYSPSGLVNYWKKLHVTEFKGSTMWGLKETSLLAKLMKVYIPSDIADMMSLWMEQETEKTAYRFSAFYSKAPQLHSEVLKERKWQWQ